MKSNNLALQQNFGWIKILFKIRGALCEPVVYFVILLTQSNMVTKCTTNHEGHKGYN
jgi:hypothetical protein